MVPHTWILQCLKILKVPNNIKNVIAKAMKTQKVELTSRRETMCGIKINRGIFQGDSLSSILFVITLILLSLLLRDMKAGFMLREFQRKINHLLFRDDLFKALWQEDGKLDFLVQIVRIFSSDISKCAMLEMKRGKVVTSEGIELPHGENNKIIRTSQGI